MINNKIFNLFILFVLAFSTIFIAYNFIGICIYGEILIREPNTILLYVETILASIFGIGSLGIFLGYTYQISRGKKKCQMK